MINYVIHAKEWHDKRNGNSYHSVRILKNDIHLLIASPFTYGYGSQFLQSARERMIKQGWIQKDILMSEITKQSYDVIETDCKKNEVEEWGEER